MVLIFERALKVLRFRVFRGFGCLGFRWFLRFKVFGV